MWVSLKSFIYLPIFHYTKINFDVFISFRHWNQEHPSLKKDDFQPSMRKLIRMIQNDHSESDSPVTPAPKVVPKDTPSALVKSNPPSKSPKKRISCRSSGCGYRTTSSLKMSEHRKDKGHFSPKKQKPQSLVTE